MRALSLSLYLPVGALSGETGTSFIYLYQGCILLTDGWPEASELVLIGVQTQLRNHKKSQKRKITQRPY